MTRPFDVLLTESAYQRKVLFAVELLDPVTLERVSNGVKVVAEGLQGDPIVNAGGLFVWRSEDIAPLRRVTIEPGVLPYEKDEIAGADVKASVGATRLTTISLRLRADYRFDGGVTGLRGSLIEARVDAPQSPTAVVDAEVRLRWLDSDGVTWHDAPPSRTDTRGDFAVILRPGPTDAPRLDTQGALTVRLHARRGTFDERRSADLTLPSGRVVDPETFSEDSKALIFAWNEMTP